MLRTDRSDLSADLSAGLTWTAVEDGGVLRVAFRGEIDIAVIEECRAGLAEPIAAGLDVVLDLSGLEFVDSSGLRLFVELKRAAESRGRELSLTGVSDSVARLLEVTGLLDWFGYADGQRPATVACPYCDAEMVPTSRRCPRCHRGHNDPSTPA